MSAEYRGLLVAAAAALATWLVCVMALPARVPMGSHMPGAKVRLEGVHGEELQRGTPFRWSGPRMRVLIRCLPFARPATLRLTVQPEPGGREVNATVLIPGLSVATVRTTEPTVTVPIPDGACRSGSAAVEMRPRVVVPPGDTRVLGPRLLGGEVDYAPGLGSAATWVREAGLVAMVLALLMVSGVLRVRGGTGSPPVVALTCAVTVACTALWPVGAPIAGPLALAGVVGGLLRKVLPTAAPVVRLAVLVIVVAFAMVMVTHAVDLPRQDEWPEIVHRLRLAEQGHWDRMDWFAQSSQHRHAVPRLVLVLAALATSWSAVAVAWIAVLAHIGAWLAVIWLLRGELDDAALVALSVVWFSPAQYESFVWGWAIHGPLTLLFSVLALVALQARRDRVGVLAAAMCCALASYCTAPGLVSWMACGGVLVASRRWRDTSWLVIAATLCAATYFAGYVRPGGYAALQFRIVSETGAGRTALDVVLGALALPFALQPPAATIAGASLLVLGVFGMFVRISIGGAALGTLGLAWWLATVLGRYDGTPALLSISRYGWAVLPLWVLVARTPRPGVLRAAALALCAIAGAHGWTRGVVLVDGWRGAMETTRDAMLSGYQPRDTALHWAPDTLPGLQADLRRWRYSLYRER